MQMQSGGQILQRRLMCRRADGYYVQPSCTHASRAHLLHHTTLLRSTSYPAAHFTSSRSVVLSCAVHSGPYKINGVPLRRVAAAYVIATSTKIDVSKVDVSKINDTFFARADSTNSKKGEKAEFIEAKKEKAPIAKERTDAQAAVDKVVLPLVKAVPNLYHYLNAKFSLTNGQKPHLLSF